MPNSRNEINNNMTIPKKSKKGGNDKHLWPQQPKIKDPEQRAKAYLRVAGLHGKVEPKSKPDLSIDGSSKNSVEMKVGRLLGNPNQRIRHEAIHQLSTFLKAKTDFRNPDSSGISELDLLKLWKGVWYCFFMSDKVPVQEELSKRIASLLFSVAGTEAEDEYAARAYLSICGDTADENIDERDDIDPNNSQDDEHGDSDDEDDDADGDSVEMEDFEDKLLNHSDGGEDESHEENSSSNENHDDDDDDDRSVENEKNELDVKHCRGAHLASLFIKTFFHTIRREWGNVDKYRVDKFYTLIRDMLNVVYQYMAMRHWNRGITRLFNDAIYDEVLVQQPDGIRYHIIDIALDEIVKVNNSLAPLSLTEATFIDCMEPFFGMLQTGGGIGHDMLQRRIIEQILEKFLLQHSIVSDNANLYYDKINSEQPSTVDENSLDKNKTSEEDGSESFLRDVHVKTIADFIFDLASDPLTHDKYRKSLYDMHKKYIQRLKEVGRDVDLDQYNDESDDNNISDGPDINECNNVVHDNDCCQQIDCNKETPEEVANNKSEDPSNKKQRKSKRKKLDACTVSDDMNLESDDHTKSVEKSLDRKSSKKGKDPEASDSAKGSDILESTKGATSSNSKKGEKKAEKLLDSSPAESAESRNDKNSKKKKKKRKHSDNLDSERHSKNRLSSEEQTKLDISEDEVVISIRDQKAAKQATLRSTESMNAATTTPAMNSNKTNSEYSVPNEHDNSNQSTSKRVKFGSMNRARSWKLSMKNLFEMETPISKTTPEQGILRNKESGKKESSSNHTKGKRNQMSHGRVKKERKKATDYF